jgi:hypothetical protein
MVTNVLNEYVTFASHAEEGGGIFLRNDGNYISDDTESHLRRTQSGLKNVVLT